MGTPAYMSPEQALGRRGTVTTASDVYGLGAILYALLTGRAPFGGDSLIETLEAVRNRPPDRPRKLNPGAPRDLETICLKCLEKDPRRRQASAQALADDLRAWLGSRPISARRVGGAERAWLWCKRKPVVAALAASVLLAAVIGTGAVIAVQTRANRQLAAKNDDLRASNAELDRQRIRALAAEGETEKRADELQKVSNFQSRMLAQVDPAQAGLRLMGDVKARFEQALARAGVPEGERPRLVGAFVDQWGRVNATDAALALIDGTILGPAVAAIDAQFQGQPLVDASLRQTLAERYRDLGLYEAAMPLLARALETRRRVLGGEALDTLISISQMGNLLKDRGKLGEAMPYYREALETSRRVLGDDHRNTLDTLHNMGSLLMAQGKLGEATPFYREALERSRRSRGKDDPATLSLIAAMGELLKEQGKSEEAMAYHREALEARRRVLGADHKDTVTSLSNLGSMLTSEGKAQDAVDCFREVAAKRRRSLGEVHPETITALRNLGTTLAAVGKDVEAEALLREALADDRRLLGSDHPDTLVALNNLAVFLIERGKVAEAEPLCLESLEKNKRLAGPDHPRTLIAASVMGYVLLRQNRPGQAEPFVREAIAISRRVNGELHRETMSYTHNLGMLLSDQGKLAEAEPCFRAVVEKGGPALGAEHPITMSATTNLGGVLNKQMRFAEAGELLAAAESAARKVATPAGERNLALLLTRLGKARAALKQFEAAEPNLLEAHATWVKTRGEAHKDTRNCKQAILDLYTDWHAARPGKGHDAKASEWRAKLGGA